MSNSYTRKPDDLLQAVSTKLHVPVVALLGQSRTRRIVLARQVAVYLCRKHTKLSLEELGVVFKKHYSTIMWSIESLENKMETETEIKQIVDELEEKLNAQG